MQTIETERMVKGYQRMIQLEKQMKILEAAAASDLSGNSSYNYYISELEQVDTRLNSKVKGLEAKIAVLKEEIEVITSKAEARKRFCNLEIERIKKQQQTPSSLQYRKMKAEYDALKVEDIAAILKMADQQKQISLKIEKNLEEEKCREALAAKKREEEGWKIWEERVARENAEAEARAKARAEEARGVVNTIVPSTPSEPPPSATPQISLIVSTKRRIQPKYVLPAKKPAPLPPAPPPKPVGKPGNRFWGQTEDQLKTYDLQMMSEEDVTLWSNAWDHEMRQQKRAEGYDISSDEE